MSNDPASPAQHQPAVKPAGPQFVSRYASQRKLPHHATIGTDSRTVDDVLSGEGKPLVDARIERQAKAIAAYNSTRGNWGRE